MLHSRLRPLPRRHRPVASFQTDPSFEQDSIAFPDLRDNDTDRDEEVEEEEDPEDLFAAFLPHLLPDDAPSFHGDPGQRLLYESPIYGPLEIMVPSYPGQSENRTEEIAAGLLKEGVNEVEEGRKLFAHILWSAAMVAAEGVEDAVAVKTGRGNVNPGKMMWSVEGHKVLELGAVSGAALPSIISALSSASRVVITDHPSSPAFSGAIDFNITQNVPASIRNQVSSHPHEWGQFIDSFSRENKGQFTRIIAADCLWMQDQHENLVNTLLWFLSPSTDDKESGKVWVVAGFHTGRAIVVSFFETAARLGLEIEDIYERDLNAAESEGQKDASTGRVQRAWMPVRKGEGPENRKRWCVIAVLKKTSSPA